MISSLVAGLSGLATLFLLSRLLTAAGYGLYAALFAAVTLVQSSAFYWLQTGILRLHSTRKEADASDRLAAAVKLAFALSCCAVAVIWLAATLFASQRVGALLWIAGLPLALLGGWLSLMRSWNRVTDRRWRMAFTDLAQGLGAPALAYAGLLVWPGEPLVAVLGAIVAAALAAALSTDLLRIAIPGIREVRAVIAELWVYGAPLTLAAFLGAALAVSDRLLVAWLVGPDAAGTYSAGYVIADRAIALALAPVAFAMKPMIFAAFDRAGDDAAERMAAGSARWLMAIGFPVATVLIFAAEPVTALLVGPAMAAGAAVIVPWVAVGAMLASLFNLHFGLAFQLSRRTGAMLLVVGPAAAANVIGNIILLPRYGAIAAAWTTVGAYALALLLAVLVGRRHARITLPLADLVAALAACAPAALILRIWPGEDAGSWLLTGSTAILAYGGTLILLRFLLGLSLRPRSAEPGQ